MKSIVPRALRAALKRWGPRRIRQSVWDVEYRSGQWQYLNPHVNDSERDPIYEVIERRSSGASILDLGCGTGSTAFELTPTYGNYLGIDISPIAIQTAADALERDSVRSSRTSFCAADILSFKSQGQFDIILFRECLCYFSVHENVGMLTRYGLNLASNGVFIVRLHDRERYRRIVGMIRQVFTVIESVVPEQSSAIILVFRPSAQARARTQ